MARYLADGNIELLGRIDHQVKVRGFRIELGEIEAVLRQHPALRDAVVIAREDVPGDKRLVGYVVAADSSPTTGELRSFLQKKLPDYMVPGVFVISKALPLTPNGKVDRQALPSPDRSRINVTDDFESPRTSMEAAIAGIWQDLLKLDQISVYDNFFDLGGHSLLSTQFVARLDKALGVHINPRELMYQTLRQLAAVCEERIHSGEHFQPVTLTRRLLTPLKKVASILSDISQES